MWLLQVHWTLKILWNGLNQDEGSGFINVSQLLASGADGVDSGAKNPLGCEGACCVRTYSESEVQTSGVGGMHGRDLWVKPTWNNISSLDKRVYESD